MIDLAAAHLETVKQILAHHVPEYDVWLFGSRATGKAKQHSDLDLVLVTRKPLPTLQMANLRTAFEESDLPIRVDLVDWSLISPEFREVIQKQYAVIQKGR